MEKKMPLIAMVATAVIVDGLRTVVPPGGELPPLPGHDERELIASGAVLDPVKAAADRAAAQREDTQAQAAFAAERAAVAEANASTAPEPTDKPAAKAKGKA